MSKRLSKDTSHLLLVVVLAALLCVSIVAGTGFRARGYVLCGAVALGYVVYTLLYLTAPKE